MIETTINRASAVHACHPHGAALRLGSATAGPPIGGGLTRTLMSLIELTTRLMGARAFTHTGRRVNARSKELE
jgi:hypothetical protein